MANEKKNEKFFYTSNQLAKACGISRATVLRLETRGLIMPHNRENATSSRMYDTTDVYRTQFLLSLQHTGFDNDVISEFLNSNYDETILRDALDSKIKQLQFVLDSINEKLDDSRHLRIGASSIVGFVGYAVPICIESDWHASIRLVAKAMDMAIRKGYQLSWLYPPSIVIPVDFQELRARGEEVNATVCIPIERASIPPSERKHIISCPEDFILPQKPCLVDVPDADYMNVSWFGEIEGMGEAFAELRKQLEDMGKPCTGFYHILLFSGEFYGDEIPSGRNSIRITHRIG